MALVQKLEMRHGQSLVMTPQLQQAIKLLQMSNLELKAFIEEEIERNPLLERAAEPAEEHAGSKPRRSAGSRRRRRGGPRSNRPQWCRRSGIPAG